jgi:2-methylisocitrate lyase-like PEP mutase family enzyme
MLRELFDDEMVLAPGCYDAPGARLVEEAGFPALYMTGFGSAASRLGRPDVGLMTLPEMVDNTRRIEQALEIPVIADADTGYGNPINVIPECSRVRGGRGGCDPPRRSGDAQEVWPHGGPGCDPGG